MQVAEIKSAPRNGALKDVLSKNADIDKVYDFELVQSYDKARPVEKESGKPLGNGYPPTYVMANGGITYDEQTEKPREWRYIEGQSSIWIDEQPLFNDAEKKDMDILMGQTQNQIVFKNGKLLVRGIERLKLMALLNSDYLEGKSIKYNRNALPVFRLNNPDDLADKGINAFELKAATMNKALEASVDKMLAICQLVGINTDNKNTEAGLVRIKNEFLKLADGDGKKLAEFSKLLSDPTTEVQYLFSKAFEDGTLSTGKRQGKLTWTDLDRDVMDVLDNVNPANYLTLKFFERNDAAMQIKEKLDDKYNMEAISESSKQKRATGVKK